MELGRDASGCFLLSLYDLLQHTKNLEKVEYLSVSSNSVYTEDKSSLANIIVLPNANFLNFINEVGINLEVEDPLNWLVNPVIVFSKLAVSSGLLRASETFGPNSYNHGELVISKIYIDTYGVFGYDDQKRPLKYSEFGFMRLNLFNDPVDQFIIVNKNLGLNSIIKRHPQLRRLLKRYCSVENILFNEKELKSKLTELGVGNNIYSYYDADELIMRLPHGTYFEILPDDLKNMVTKLIDVFVDNFMPSGYILSDLIGSIIDDGVNPSGGKPIGDIFEKLRNTSSFGKVHETAGGERKMNTFIGKMGGMTNIINTAISSVVDHLAETEPDDV